MHAALLVALSLSIAPKVLDFQVGARPQVTASNVAGPIAIAGGAGESAHVEARWEGGTEAEQAQWTVDARGSEGRLQVRVCCGPCEAREHSGCNSKAHVALTLRVPAGSSVELNQVSGDSQVSGVKGALRLHSVSGSLRAEGSEGSLQVETVDGAVRLAPAKLEEVKLHAVGGHFELALPQGAGAEVHFHAVGGKYNGRTVALGDVRERVGPGGARVDCDVVGGSLEVR